VVGSFFPGYSSAQRLVLAAAVANDELRLTRAGGVLNAVNESASFVGPALGGTLVALIGATNVLFLDAGSYLCAFALVALLVPAVREPADGDAGGTGVAEGLRYLRRRRRLRGEVAGLGLVEVGWTAMIATLPVLALRAGGAATAGWLIASYGAGSVVGGLVSARARATGAATRAWAVAGIAASTWLLALPVPVWARALAVAADGVCSGLFFARFFAGLTTGTPPALRARVMTSVQILIAAPGPVGFLGAGLLAQHTGSVLPGLLLAGTAATLGAVLVVVALQLPVHDMQADEAVPRVVEGLRHGTDDGEPE
jgi:hypothetical protein